MGFDIKRFVGEVNQQFICGVCNGVLQKPLVVKECQHFYCNNCVKKLMKTSPICPKDKSLLSYSQLIEPQNLIINLLNDLKIKCDFGYNGCEEVSPLGQLDKHLKVCERNPLNTKQINCFCGQQIAAKALTEHQNNCLPSIKNQIHINRSQISTFMADIYSQCTGMVSGKRFRSEIEYLYHKLSESLPQRSRNQNSIENILLYLNWRLLEYKPSPEELYKIKLGLQDLNRATLTTNEGLRIFNRLNGLDHILLIQNVTKNRDIQQTITDVLVNFCHSEIHLNKLMERPILDLLLNLMNSKLNGIETSFNCVDILSHIVVTLNPNWNHFSSPKERKDILTKIKTAVNDWKLNVKLRKYSTLENQISKLKTYLNEMPTEVLYRYLWVLVHHSRADPKKYVPMIEEQNVIQLLDKHLENQKTEPYIKQLFALLSYQMTTFKSLGHLNGLENSDKREIIPN